MRPARDRDPRSFIALVGLILTLGGCATMGERGASLVPTRHRAQDGPFLVHTNYPLPVEGSPLATLADLRGQFEETLGIKVDPGGDPIEVYILNDRREFEHFLTFYYPSLPSRRAFFIAQDGRRVIYTFHGDRLDEDLRHEGTHALLNLAVGDVPLWLDEGLAEYFEDAGDRSRGPGHLARLQDDLKAGETPDLTRLEAMKGVKEMTPRDYREAWGWVDFSLHAGGGGGRAALLAHINALKSGRPTGPFLARLGPTAGSQADAFKSYILDRTEPPARADKIAIEPVPASEPSIRLQDAATEPKSSPPAVKRRGLLGRLFGRTDG